MSSLDVGDTVFVEWSQAHRRVEEGNVALKLIEASRQCRTEFRFMASESGLYLRRVFEVERGKLYLLWVRK